MAGNDWVNSYLEAILDVGQPLDDARPSLLLRERGRFTPSRYFVEEVITGFDETDLHRSWVKVCFFLCGFMRCVIHRCDDECDLMGFFLGCRYEESSGEEHKIGEYVLEDLESCSSKEAGYSFLYFAFLQI